MVPTKKTYFNFNDQNTNLDHRILLNCTEAEWEKYYEEEIEEYPPFMEKLEELAVHDATSGFDENGNNLCGFTSNEVEDEETLQKVLSIWKKELMRKGWVQQKDTFLCVPEV